MAEWFMFPEDVNKLVLMKKYSIRFWNLSSPDVRKQRKRKMEFLCRNIRVICCVITHHTHCIKSEKNISSEGNFEYPYLACMIVRQSKHKDISVDHLSCTVVCNVRMV